jgi:hypothetical protein
MTKATRFPTLPVSKADALTAEGVIFSQKSTFGQKSTFALNLRVVSIPMPYVPVVTEFQ